MTRAAVATWVRSNSGGLLPTAADHTPANRVIQICFPDGRASNRLRGMNRTLKFEVVSHPLDLILGFKSLVLDGRNVNDCSEIKGVQSFRHRFCAVKVVRDRFIDASLAPFHGRRPSSTT